MTTFSKKFLQFLKIQLIFNSFQDPEKRLTLDEISEHPWVTAGGTWESTHLKGPYLTPKQVLFLYSVILMCFPLKIFFPYLFQVAVRVRSFPKLRAIWI